MKIVLVDDNPLLRKTMRNLLVKLPCEVKEFSSGEEAITYLIDSNFSYDLVILDGNLASPYLSEKTKPCNGPDVAEAILKYNKDIPIVVWTDDPMMITAFQEKFDAHNKGPILKLKKPIEPANLKEVLMPFIEAVAQETEDRPSVRPRSFTSPGF
ncbi:response regulator [Legionella cardiaca]|uniref:Response regulator n=1 Tax=Legionella cardiaca TaxID=1071983 RepID=A0ABY8AVF6_9GAMM|nr:response regulator [Legionella cardiaca]WED44141.1 response regulator [Legionella cardiaca]